MRGLRLTERGKLLLEVLALTVCVLVVGFLLAVLSA